MNALCAEQFDDVLAEAAQPYASATQLRSSGGYAEDVPLGRIGLHAQQQVGRGQMEETKRVRLDHLRQVQHAAQLRGSMRNAHGHDGFAGLGRGQQVRDGADTADARRDAGHLVEWTALGESLESTHLGYMKVRVFNFALRVQLDRDLAMSFEAGYRIDRDGLAHYRTPWGSGSKAGEGRNIQRLTGDQRRQRCVECIGRWRAAGKEDIHLHKFVDRSYDLQQLGHHDAGNLLLYGCVFDVGAIENSLRPE